MLYCRHGMDTSPLLEMTLLVIPSGHILIVQRIVRINVVHSDCVIHTRIFILNVLTIILHPFLIIMVFSS